MTDLEFKQVAEVIYEEAGVLATNYNALLGVAQAIHDIWITKELGDISITEVLKRGFTSGKGNTTEACRKAAYDVFYNGKRRFENFYILQFRSFKKYGDGNGNPAYDKLTTLTDKYIYLGKDSISKEWGHFYFGRGVKQMGFKMLLIAGHGRNVDGSWDPGATANLYQEANLTRELTQLIKKKADQFGISCDVAPDRNYYSYFKHGGTYDFTPYKYVLEIHFNASGTVDSIGDGKKKGSMVYIDKSEKGHSVEDAILNNLYSIGSVQAWDGVVVTQRQASYRNGLMVQSKVRAQGVSHAVLETCFITDVDDVNWYLTNKTRIAEAVVGGIMKGFKLGDYSTKGQTDVHYAVKVTDLALNIRKEPDVNSAKVGCIRDYGVYTIIKESVGPGASKWGYLLSGAGWISLDYVKKV